MANPSGQPKTALKGNVVISDGATPTPTSITIPFTLGDFTVGPLSEYLNELVILIARSVIAGVARGAPRPPQLSFSALCGNLVGADAVAPGSPAELVWRKGAHAAAVSTLGASRDMAVDVTVTIEGTDHGDSADETWTVEDAILDITPTEAMEGNKLEFSGQGVGAVVIDNDANTVTLQQAA